MADSLIDEFARARPPLQDHFIRRCQREFRERIQPQLEERDALLLEVARLRTELAALQADPKRAKKAADVPAGIAS